MSEKLGASSERAQLQAVELSDALPKPAPRVAHQRAARLLLAETHRDYWQAVRSELINQLAR